MSGMKKRGPARKDPKRKKANPEMNFEAPGESENHKKWRRKGGHRTAIDMSVSIDQP